MQKLSLLTWHIKNHSLSAKFAIKSKNFGLNFKLLGHTFRKVSGYFQNFCRHFFKFYKLIAILIRYCRAFNEADRFSVRMQHVAHLRQIKHETLSMLIDRSFSAMQFFAKLFQYRLVISRFKRHIVVNLHIVIRTRSWHGQLTFFRPRKIY